MGGNRTSLAGGSAATRGAWVCGGMLALLVLAFMAARCVIAAPPINIPPLQPQLTSTTPRIYIGAKDPNPSVPSKWEVITSVPVLGIHVAQVPGTEAFLMVGRSPPENVTYAAWEELAAVYDYSSNSYRNISVPTNPFCLGLTPTHDGRVFTAGGNFISSTGTPDGRRGIRVYDYQSSPVNLPDIARMKWRRWYPTTTLMPDNTILINGGTYTGAEFGEPSQYYERWSPSNPTAMAGLYQLDTEYFQKAGKNFYPFQFVLPTGEVLWLIDSISRVMKPDFTFRKKADGSFVTLPTYPTQWKTQFPHSGSAALVGFTSANGYSSVDLVVFGGAPASSGCTATVQEAQLTAANPYSFRITISWALQGGDWVYTFGNWEQELMGIPRVGGQAVGLPNGDIVLVAGAQTGCVGGIVNSTLRGNNPAFWSLLYQPDRPSGQRYTVLSASALPRVYHGTGVLTTDGTILVSGCDACNKKYFVTNITFWTPIKTRREYRVEKFTPPYALDVNAKPAITSVNGNTNANSVISATYGGTITISWKPTVSTETDLKITSVVLVAPTSATHGFNSNYRVVPLPITSGTPPITSTTLTVQVPNNRNLLPPQFYMLFLNNGKTYSKARWVRLA